MNSNLKRTLTTALCGAMILSAAGCGANTRTALTVDGEELNAGIYIYYQMSALGDAQEKLGEEQPDLDMSAEDFDITAYSVEGTNVSEWVKNKAIEQCRKYVAINKKFDELGLSLTADENSEINDYVSELWTEENVYAQYIYGVDIIGEYYEQYGIGEQSFKSIYAMSYKQDKIFDALYGEGGSLEVSADELKANVVENYALVKYIEIEEGYDAEEYCAMLDAGKSFSEMKQAYDTAVELAQIEADMAEAEENGEQYAGTYPEELVVAASEESELETVIKKDSDDPSEDFVSAVFAMNNGDNKVIAESNETTDADGNNVTTVTFYVASKLDITENEEVLDSYCDTVLHEQKDEEFDASIEAEASGLSVTENADAIKRYTVKNLMK